MTQPELLKPVRELNNLRKEVIPAVHVFNALMLDDKSRWYTEEITPQYWANLQEYETYCQKIKPSKPLDFATIRVGDDLASFSYSLFPSHHSVSVRMSECTHFML